MAIANGRVSGNIVTGHVAQNRVSETPASKVHNAQINGASFPTQQKLAGAQPNTDRRRFLVG